MNTSNRLFYDFWRLCVDSNGAPTTCSGNSCPTCVGEIKSGSLNQSSGWLGGDTASGISGLAGDILPGELDFGLPVPHALSVVAPSSMMNNQVCTAAVATNTDGSVAGAVFCEGAKLRMDPSINVDSLIASPAAKSIMKTMQVYGAVIVDLTGCSNCLSFYPSLASQPDLTGLGTNLLPHLWIYYSH